ncbi:MAG: aldehyde dehydrogenase family protein, partial [Bdellovibrionales bacterium]|nr:aldehyde dehydrogenase family protein [Bdellovibrionales bacterium]
SEVQLKLTLAESEVLKIKKNLPVNRVQNVLKLGELLHSRSEKLAQLMTLEMGKRYSESLAEIKKCADSCEALIREFENATASFESTAIQIQPSGVILGIMPWNFPFWQVIRFAVPAILVGNSVLLKHAPNVQLCAKELVQLFRDAGFAKGAFQNLAIEVQFVAKIIEDNRITGVSLTGSTRAGQQVAELAGRHLKKCVLELGGNDPSLVLHDADIEAAVNSVFTSRNLNNGQSCISAKRAIVHKSRLDDFIDLYDQKLSDCVIGDPMQPTTTVAPLVRKDIRDQTLSQLENLIQVGGALVTAGLNIPKKGYFVDPGYILKFDSKLFDEEIFAPFLVIYCFQNNEEAIQMANQSKYGLGASVYSNDIENAKRIANQLDSGSVFINDFVKSIPDLPFGGVKQSGYGRELSTFSFFEFANIKTLK